MGDNEHPLLGGRAPLAVLPPQLEQGPEEHGPGFAQAGLPGEHGAVGDG